MQSIFDNLTANPILNKALSLVLNVVIVLLVLFVILRVSRKVFRTIQQKKQGANTMFAEKVFRFVVIFLSVMWLIMSNDFTKSFGQSVFQSTAVIAAIAGFAAQSVLSDLICGLIINSTKPFEVGNRIELENGIAGIVKEITLRHVILQGVDTQVYVIPNSKINVQYLRNMSYHAQTRSVDFHFSVSYDSDPEFAARVIRQAVEDSPLSVPGRENRETGEPEYAQVYFVAFRDSSLDMETTGYYMPGTPTEVFKNDINTRVIKALKQNGIEIPYSYLNVKLAQRDPS